MEYFITHASRAYHAKAKRGVSLLSYIPFSRAYLLTGSVARGSAQKESDIDIIAVAHAKFVWLHRALLFIFLFLVRLRRTRNNRAGRICICASVNSLAKDHFTARPHDILLWQGKPTLYALERILIYLRAAHVGEFFARRTISFYILRQFKSHRGRPDTVLRLDKGVIEYYPPRLNELKNLSVPNPRFSRL